MDEVNAAWLRNLLYSTKDDGSARFSAATRIVMQSALNLFYSWAMREGFAFDNPVERLAEERAKDRKALGRGGRRPARLPKVLSWEQQDHLMAIVQGNPRKFTAARDSALTGLTLLAGLRREELCDLQTPDVDLAGGQLRVTGKGNKERLVRFNAKEALGACEDWMAVRKERGWNGSGPFFRTGTGEAMTPSLVYQQVSSYLAKLEEEQGFPLPSKGPHLLRHTSCSAQLAKGVPITTVRANLGHESLATLTLYAHLLPPRT
ncbi:tyrosine recombinase XerC [Ramlibacter alkalitolerans]